MVALVVHLLYVPAGNSRNLRTHFDLGIERQMATSYNVCECANGVSIPTLLRRLPILRMATIGSGCTVRLPNSVRGPLPAIDEKGCHRGKRNRFSYDGNDQPGPD